MHPTVIIGTGMAGYTVARELRKLDATTPLVIISADAGHFYSKPMLSNALAKSKTAEAMVTTTADKMADQLGASVKNYTTASVIKPAEQVVVCEHNGKLVEISYHRLVLAVGAGQRQPPLQGTAVSDILSVNNLNDYALFESRLAGCKHVTVMGSGLIGCEFANDLVINGREVVVVGTSNTPLARLLPRKVGEYFQHKLAEQGVHWKNGVKATHLDKVNDQYQLLLSDNTSINTDLVLSAIGLEPQLKLAQSAAIDTNRGIIVDAGLQTNVKNIYAIGDCAEINGAVLPYILPIMHSARALAKTLINGKTTVKFPVMPVVVKTPAHAVVVVSPPPDVVGQWEIEHKNNGICALYRDHNGHLLGYALTGSEVMHKQQLSKEILRAPEN